ncbi:MAG: deoxyribodipyrimidine photo-lyase [Planctomycetota bacterium]
MATRVVHPDRIQPLNDEPVRSDAEYVLYWMQSSMRTVHNDALEHAVRRANELGLPVLACYGLMDDYPGSTARSKRFMVDGLVDVRDALAKRRIGFALHREDCVDQAVRLAGAAALAVTDRGYLRHERAFRAAAADRFDCPLEQVEADVVVPIEVASDKLEFAARTIRPKITRCLGEFLVALDPTPVKHPWPGLNIEGDPVDLTDLDDLIADMPGLDHAVPPVPMFTGGQREAHRLLDAFLDRSAGVYDAHRNQPQTEDVSHMSKYLHFGQVSPVKLALAIESAWANHKDDRESYLEELIVRRELAINFAYYAPNTYDTFDCMPDWARKTIAEHADDPRDPEYTLEQLDDAQTHDPYWNAAMREMRYTGYMHNYMRMYWGKKIIEWSPSAREAFDRMIHLNDKYFIDGRDPNSYTGIAWCFGVHDRAWTERPVLGKLRYMNANGLKRKADPDAYVAKVDRLVAEVTGQEAPAA